MYKLTMNTKTLTKRGRGAHASTAKQTMRTKPRNVTTRATRKKGRDSKSTRQLKRRRDGTIVFTDHSEFRPNLTPTEMFALGSFGGTYWRPIYSAIAKKRLQNVHKTYPKSWWKDVPENWLSSPNYDKTINKYGVRVGTSLEFWEEKGWITKYNPYGWVHWYCDFYMGKRGPDDDRQIARWLALASDKGRFRNFLVNLIKKKYSGHAVDGLTDTSISPKIRQVLQHWAYVLKPSDVK